MKKHVFYIWCLGLAVCFPAAVLAQPPLNFGNADPIVDEFGVLLQGTAENPGDLVQLLKTQGNIGIIPPGPDGTPNTNNVVLEVVYIGNGVDPKLGSTGGFAGSVALDRSVVNYLFFRIFNGPTLASSSFYTDSQIKVVNQTDYTAFIAQANQTAIELDPNDDDGDGLSNSWEKSMGTNKLIPDTDGDGVSDYNEFLSGTDPLDISDYLQLVELIRNAGDGMTVQWSSVSGKTYQVEYSTNSLNASVVEYINLDLPVVAVTNQTSLVFTNSAMMNNPHFRVRFVPLN